MRFLCPAHYQQLSLQSSQDLEKSWFDWMNKAALYYGVAAWRESQAYAGCALEVGLMLLNKSRANSVTHQITLSSLYLANALEHESLLDKADLILQVAKKALTFCNQHCMNDDADNCLAILGDQKQQPKYFSEHLNMPFDLPPKAQALGMLH